MKTKTILRKTRNALRFVGRHFFTLCVFCLFIVALFKYGRFDVSLLFIELTIAIFFDWLKMRAKPGSGSYVSSMESIPSFTRDNYWNSSIVGTTSYLSDLGRR